ncbi:MAG: hypothetical protein HYV63_31395, partial [Candidatus Schekmanbacteria bacterium]|nr:hypothetical protein [Candidatus Schekmanbacteria bacterium]
MRTRALSCLFAAWSASALLAGPAFAEDAPPPLGTATAVGAPLLLSPAATDTVAPAWPDGGRLTAAFVAMEEVTLEWTAATDAEAVTAYRIYRNGRLRDTVASEERRYASPLAKIRPSVPARSRPGCESEISTGSRFHGSIRQSRATGKGLGNGP